MSGPFVLVFFSLLPCCTHFVLFSGVYSVFIFYLIKWTVDAQHKVLRIYNQVVRTDGRGRGASVQVSPARHVDDVTTNITEEAAESSHDGSSHKRTATRVMASYALPVTRASLFLFKLTHFNAQGLCAPVRVVPLTIIRLLISTELYSGVTSVNI